MPVIGYPAVHRLRTEGIFWRRSGEAFAKAAMSRGENVTIEYRWAQDQYDRLPDFATDLIRRHVLLIAATDTPSATAAKARNHDVTDRVRQRSRPDQGRPSH